MIRSALVALFPLLSACGPLATGAASRVARPVLADIVGEWTRTLPPTFDGDPEAPVATVPAPGSATAALVDDCFAARVSGRARRALHEAADGAAAVAERLKDREIDETRLAPLVAILGEMPPLRAAPVLVWLLEHERPIVRRLAAHQLGKVGPDFVVPYLLVRLRFSNERDDEARAWAADAICRLGNAEGIPTLIECVGIESAREVAGERLVEILAREHVAYESAEGWDALTRKARDLHRAWRQRIVPAADGPLRIVLARRIASLPSTDLRTVDNARFILARMGSRGVSMLAQAIKDQSPYVRTHSLEVLRDLGPCARDAGAAIAQALGDPLLEMYACEAIGRVGYEPALPELVTRVDATALDVRIGALKGLAALGKPAATPVAARVFADPRRSADERVHAAFALARCGDAAARSHLEAALADGTYHVPTLRAMLDELRP